MGLLLGDGSIKRSIAVTTADEKIVSIVEKNAKKLGCRIRKEDHIDNKSSTYYIPHNLDKNDYNHKYGTLRCALKELNLLGKDSSTKFIPDLYKLNSEKIRLSVLAGLIDSDGNLWCNTYRITSKSRSLAEDVVFVARSLGLASYIKKKIVDGQIYHRVSISGDIDKIPCLLNRKKAKKRKQIKNVLRTGFTLEKVSEKEDYYGVSVDKDNRYIMGDFTVTHNCGKTIMLLEAYLRLGQPCLWLTHTVGLGEQVAERLKEFTGLEAGIIGDSKENIEHFTVGIIPTLVRRDLNKYKDLFGMVVIDEAHHVPSSSFSSVINSFNAHYRYAVTATPYRDDGLEPLLFQMCGDITTKIEKQYLRDIGMLMTPTVLRKETPYTFPYDSKKKGHQYKDLKKDISFCEKRNDMILNDVLTEVGIEENICIVLVATVEHAEEMNSLISDIYSNVSIIHSKQRRKFRKENMEKFLSGENRVLVATYKMLSEGFDHKPSNRLFLTGPFKGKSLIEQACGRVERVCSGKEDAVVYDYMDSKVSVLNSQAYERLDVYESSNNIIKTIRDI